MSAKVPKELKDELERRGAKLSDAIRKGLEMELTELKVRELEVTLHEIDFSKVSEELIVHDVRETREER